MKLIAVAAMVLSTTAVAQPDKDWWACQVVHTSGMKWENNRWVTKTFNDAPPFVLMSDGNGSLIREYVSKALIGYPGFGDQITCDTFEFWDTITCHNLSGSALLFNSKTGRGGISYLLGTEDGRSSNRDPVTINAFECTKG